MNNTPYFNSEQEADDQRDAITEALTEPAAAVTSPQTMPLLEAIRAGARSGTVARRIAPFKWTNVKMSGGGWRVTVTYTNHDGSEMKVEYTDREVCEDAYSTCGYSCLILISTNYQVGVNNNDYDYRA